MTDDGEKNGIPEYPGESSAPEHRASEAQPVGDEKKSNKKLLIGIAALIAIILVVVQLVLYAGRGEDDSAETNAAEEQTSTSQSVEAEAPTTNNDPFVDDSGEQEHELEPAPGEFRGFGAMSLGINDEFAAVDPIQVTDTGMLIPPHDVQRLGWYSASAVPGEAGPVGSSVITGHINYQGQGTGFAEKFTTMELGQEFTVFIDGEGRRFRVTEAPYRLQKGAGFPDVVNDTQGDNRLVLITCGGKFVGGQLGYEDNIITVAEPVAPVEGAEAPVDGGVEAPAEAPAA
ncbi:peptidase C60 [Corynebacterium sp. HMSC076G08]|uniref:class F sortase n=1 Tax=Corynebacterium sp. HMSC076G08 TaxID=1739310 RepID=UPI0008A56F30|nr:class F sortase [Corynebacterium sp. HMSC076G08]OFK64819.1 peptidase C60 [Corynebacterium sp. HMSC076G08]